MKLDKRILFVVIVVVAAILIGGGLALRYKNNTSLSDVAAKTTDGCVHNPSYKCPQNSGSVDFYPSPGEGPGNPAYNPQPNDIGREILGTITSYRANEVGIRASNGQIFKINFPISGVDWWNQNRAPNYGSFRVDVGDPLLVSYAEQPNQRSNTIQANQIQFSEVLVQTSKASGTISHITNFSFN